MATIKCISLFFHIFSAVVLTLISIWEVEEEWPALTHTVTPKGALGAPGPDRIGFY